MTNAVNFLEYYEAVNTMSGQLLTSIMLFVVFVLIFIIFSNYDKKIVIFADSFICSILGILFFSLNLIGWGVLIVPIITFLFSLLFLKIYD
jgi:hypothetical protein